MLVRASLDGRFIPRDAMHSAALIIGLLSLHPTVTLRRCCVERSDELLTYGIVSSPTFTDLAIVSPAILMRNLLYATNAQCDCDSQISCFNVHRNHFSIL